MSLTDSRRLYVELRDAGTKGVHSWDCYGWTRNASQRAKDVTSKGQQVWKRSERRNGRAGTRFWLDGFQPSDAVRVAPNGDSEGGGDDRRSGTQSGPVRSGAAPLSITPAPADTKEPTAIVRDWDGVWRELPIGENGFPLEEAA